ncbi:unnamed protein product [Heterobilharzia americana]|nr:unnamed protein product [Heterobilharzia americana]CAH8618133.1 unnamed protein product [Heterobilharzia americana]
MYIFSIIDAFASVYLSSVEILMLWLFYVFGIVICLTTPTHVYSNSINRTVIGQSPFPLQYQIPPEEFFEDIPRELRNDFERCLQEAVRKAHGEKSKNSANQYRRNILLLSVCTIFTTIAMFTCI